MAEFLFDLNDLFQQSFGYTPQVFNPEFNPVAGDSNNPSPRTEQGASGSPYYAPGILGREYYMPVKLSYATSGDNTLSDGSTSQNYEMDLPYPVISISGRKTIVETPLTERRGTVKELINTMDYEIVIRGFIINTAHEFPEQLTTRLRNFYEQNVPLSIQCPLTDIFLLRPDRSGSDQVVITDLKFPGLAGVKNVYPYELRLQSEEPFNLITIS